MAGFLELWSDRHSVFSAIKESCIEANHCREREYVAAIRIQSWFRGCRVRAYLCYLNDCATRIQAAYRGHYYQNKYREKLKEYYEQQKQNFYNKMATLIQSTWRGYFVRKYVHNYYAQKKYYEALKLKNEIVRKHLNEHKESVLKELLVREEEVEKLLRSKEARKYHYMLSTECSEGIFKSGNCPSFEDEMGSVQFLYKQKSKSRMLSKASTLADRVSITSETSPPTNTSIDLSAATGDCRLRHGLPPVVNVKGPFRSPEDVQQQRRRPLRPSLRVATSFDSVEQARMELKLAEEQRIHVEDQFLPFSKVHSRYTPMLGSQTPYTKSEYGTKHFRHVHGPVDNHNKKKFNSVVPPIPIFEELNTTY